MIKYQNQKYIYNILMKFKISDSVESCIIELRLQRNEI